ncbi:sigma factor-like helix-turn-helix DNA-binding protein [Streptomyces sp. NPDC058955]|uniref:sigma factor-like helix-turn-helix DNA-binding protein n=1 Tax=unclassified Streptomyces TaxID=2593676 RepID=UPI00366230D3
MTPTARFEEHRARLRAVAERLLGSAAEAEAAVDAVREEVWPGLARTGPPGDTALDDRMTAAVARVCLDLLRARTAGGAGASRPDGGVGGDAAGAADAEQRVLRAALDALTPSERVAFVLHDLFAVPYEGIAPVVDRVPAAARRLAGRARRRVQGAEDMPEPDPTRQREVVAAFLAAARAGDAGALDELLDPDVVLRADTTAVRTGATGARGPRSVSRAFTGRAARTARPALVDGAAGLAWAPDDTARAVCRFTVLDGRITAIDLVADPGRLAAVDLRFLDRRLHGAP